MTFGEFMDSIPFQSGQKLFIIHRQWTWRIKCTDFSKIAMIFDYEIEKIKACKGDDYIYVYLQGEQKNVR